MRLETIHVIHFCNPIKLDVIPLRTLLHTSK